MVSRPMPQETSDGEALTTRPRLPVISTVAIVVGVVLGGAALRTAAVVFIPLVVGLFLALLLWPLYRVISKRAPGWLGATASALVVIVFLALAAGVTWLSADMAVKEFQGSQREYLKSYRDLRGWLVGHGAPETWLPQTSEQGGQDAAGGATGPSESGRDGDPAAAAPAQNGDASWFSNLPDGTRQRMVGYLTGGLGGALNTLVAILLSVFLMFLMLLEAPRWRERVDRALNGQHRDRVNTVAKEWGHQIRRYLLAKSITGVVSGGSTALFLWAMGVPLPWVWGLLTFFMNFIPNVGAFISGIPPTILAFFQLGLSEGLIVAGGLVAIEILVGNLLGPLLLGDMMKLSACFVLASLIFWGWLWGVAGALLAVPMSALVVLWMAHTPRLKPAAQLVMDES